MENRLFSEARCFSLRVPLRYLPPNKGGVPRDYVEIESRPNTRELDRFLHNITICVCVFMAAKDLSPPDGVAKFEFDEYLGGITLAINRPYVFPMCIFFMQSL